MDESLINEIAMETTKDQFAQAIKKSLETPTKGVPRYDLDQFTLREGLIFRNNLVYVPDGPSQIHILKECHDNALASHFAVTKTV